MSKNLPDRVNCSWPGCTAPSCVSVVAAPVCGGHFYTCSDVVDTFRSHNGVVAFMDLCLALAKGCEDLDASQIVLELDEAWEKIQPKLTGVSDE